MACLAAIAREVRAKKLLLVLALASALAGCSLFDNLDRFHPQDAGSDSQDGGDAGDAGDAATDAGGAGAGDAATDAGGAGGATARGCENAQTLCVRLQHFTPHINELVGLDLVTSDNILRARVLLDPLAPNGGADADIVLPLAIPTSEVPGPGEKHSLHLEIFGDHNHDGKYTSDGSDHDWKVDLPADGKLVFPHNSQFKRLLPRPASIGGDFRMHLNGMGVHTGKLLEVIVIENDSGRTVGLYRMQSIPGDGFDITIPGIIDVGGVVYRVEFYADANGNFQYDGLPTDHTWIRFTESNDQGVDVDFTHGTDFKELTYEFTLTP